MGKISPVSIKYIIHASIKLNGLIDKPDVIGAVFGQTEGLLGTELELRELQKSGRIGRIDVKLETKSGNTEGEIFLPSSMGKSETAIIAASLETIERVGPCDAKIKVTNIEDVRVAKRNFILDRAKDLLKGLVGDMPDSQAFTNQVTQTVRTLEITEYGKDRLPAGPNIEDVEEIVIVEGRADVINLLKYGIRNVVGLNGATTSDSIIDLLKKKVVTLFVDGDRGGDLIVRKLASLADIDFVAKAPDGKEVEELTLKEINKSLRAKIAWEQAQEEFKSVSQLKEKQQVSRKPQQRKTSNTGFERRTSVEDIPKKSLKLIRQMAEELIGTRGAFVLDEALNILGKVPIKELNDTLKNMTDDIFAIVMDGTADNRLAKLANSKNVKYLVATSSQVTERVSTKILISSKI